MKGMQYRFKFKALVTLLLLVVCFAPMGLAPRGALAADAQQEIKVLRSMVDALALSVASASEDNAALRREVAELRREVAALRAAVSVPSGSNKAQGTPEKRVEEKGDKEEDNEMNALLKSFLKQVLTHAVETLELDAPQEKGKR